MAIRRPKSGRFLAVSVLVVAATTVATVTPAMAAPATGQIRLAGTTDAVAGSYIVVLKDSAVATKANRVAAVGDKSAGLARGYGAEVRRTFGAALNGFEAGMSEAARSLRGACWPEPASASSTRASVRQVPPGNGTIAEPVRPAR